MTTTNQSSETYVPSLNEMFDIARMVVRGPNRRRTMSAGYDIKAGERALLAVNSFYDPGVVDSVVRAIREIGARVDVVWTDMGPDRPLTFRDEAMMMMHNWPGIPEKNEARAWLDRVAWVERVADSEGYDILIHALAGPLPDTHCRYEGIPWAFPEVFTGAAFPYPLWSLINEKSWAMIWKDGRGGTVRITDPEGTDLSFNLHEDYYNVERQKVNRFPPRFREQAAYGHLFTRPTPPYFDKKLGGTGVVAGTTNHMGRPYPHIRVELTDGRLSGIHGGGEYGDLWRDMERATANVKYPEHPEEGLFWWWESALGTNPKMRRQRNAFRLSGGGTLYERMRSGFIHIGIGSGLDGLSEDWAREQGITYGHMHVHLMFPTYEITTRDGRKLKVVDNGRLTALDDPEVRELARKFGDPDKLLKETWEPAVPGISIPGDYWRDYAPNPAAWIEAHPDFMVTVR